MFESASKVVISNQCDEPVMLKNFCDAEAIEKRNSTHLTIQKSTVRSLNRAMKHARKAQNILDKVIIELNMQMDLTTLQAPSRTSCQDKNQQKTHERIASSSSSRCCKGRNISANTSSLPRSPPSSGTSTFSSSCSSCNDSESDAADAQQEHQNQHVRKGVSNFERSHSQRLSESVICATQSLTFAHAL